MKLILKLYKLTSISFKTDLFTAAYYIIGRNPLKLFILI